MLLSGHVKCVSQMQRCGTPKQAFDKSKGGKPRMRPFHYGGTHSFETFWQAEVLDKMDRNIMY